ncbi:hypothetical protein OXB_0925 [Bacillus sp. OxB-1]|uniref:hypothetical protein n=1 Tax=Bacillus sp. (strain OxB-1) TaxID=98228 RepID=UPI000581E790|nr:hypothetical protein [Bacillus sp. OxB-1]BAQ09273.1 hypothetical protein OXB_0801 [Bacillus sp. OxB-1]BAQ09397.1 hypothetical protein OXB_0925 [Bacillus sp. OxB-1]
MPQKPLTIVPVTLYPASNDSLPAVSSKSPGSCTVHFGHAEVTFQNGVEDRLIQTVIRELINR